MSSDRYKTPGRARDPARLGAVWISQLDNHYVVIADRIAGFPSKYYFDEARSDRQPRHRFLEPIHNVKEGPEPHIRGRSRETVCFISGNSLPPLRR